jgi:hypothetical protein
LEKKGLLRKQGPRYHPAGAVKEFESRQHAPRDLETGSNGGNLLKSNLKSKPQILKQDHPHSYGMQFQHKMVYQCILYVPFRTLKKDFTVSL